MQLVQGNNFAKFCTSSQKKCNSEKKQKCNSVPYMCEYVCKEHGDLRGSWNGRVTELHRCLTGYPVSSDTNVEEDESIYHKVY